MKNDKGFTLLEVMIAVTIFALASFAIYSTQSRSIFLTIRTKELNVASVLVHNLMIESELLLENKAFTELKKEEAGDFKFPYETFKWKREVKEIQFPLLSQEKDDQSMMIAQGMSKFLSDGVRELVVTVSWQKGEDTEKVTLSTYLINMETKFNLTQ